MAAIDNNKNWWKLEDVDSLTDETSGKTLLKVGSPTNQLGLYGNGVYNNNGTYSLRDTTYVADINRFAVGQWVKLDYNVVNGHPSDNSRHYDFVFVNGSNLFIFGFNVAGTDVCIFNRKSGGATVSLVSTNINITAGVWTYILFVYDQTGIAGGSDTNRIYIGDTLTENYSSVPDNQPNTNWTSYWLSNQSINSPLDGVSDNIKTYEFSAQITEQNITDIINNRNTEGFESAPVNPENVSATSGLFTDRIEVGWDAVTSATTYSLHRSLTSTSGFSVISAGQAGTSYTDTSVSPSITYYYLAYAENTVGTSTASSVDSGFLRNFSQYNFHSTILKTVTSANTILKTATAHSTILMTMGVSSILN